MPDPTFLSAGDRVVSTRSLVYGAVLAIAGRRSPLNVPEGSLGTVQSVYDTGVQVVWDVDTKMLPKLVLEQYVTLERKVPDANVR